MQSISNEVALTIANVLQERHGFATVSMLDKAVADIVRRTHDRTSRGNSFSLSTMVRGMAAIAGNCLNESTKDADIQFTRALTTTGTPGSYLVPTQQADEILAMLSIGGVARQAGVRIVPMSGLQKLNIPSALAAPSWVWMAQNSVQTASDPNLGQVAFDLKTRRCLTAVPNELLRTSVPAFDTLLSQLIAQAAAEHEDTALFATSTVSGGPVAFMSVSGITTLNASGNNANGGNLTYADILATLAKTASVKAKPPFVWFMSPRTFYQRVLGLIDLQSRPITVPTATQGLYPAAQYSLMGFPVFVTPASKTRFGLTKIACDWFEPEPTASFSRIAGQPDRNPRSSPDGRGGCTGCRASRASRHQLTRTTKRTWGRAKCLAPIFFKGGENV